MPNFPEELSLDEFPLKDTYGLREHRIVKRDGYFASKCTIYSVHIVYIVNCIYYTMYVLVRCSLYKHNIE